MNTTLTTAAKTARKQKVVIEYRDIDREWWVMFDSGDVQMFDTASAALNAVKKTARAKNQGVTITTVEWRNVRDGWTPPT